MSRPQSRAVLADRPRLDFPPVVAGLPVLREIAHGRESYALGFVGDLLLVGPAGRRDAPAKFGQLLFGCLEAKWTNAIALGRGCQSRREQARGTCNSDAHRSRTQKPTTILIDCFLARVHGTLLGSMGCSWLHLRAWTYARWARGNVGALASVGPSTRLERLNKLVLRCPSSSSALRLTIANGAFW